MDVYLDCLKREAAGYEGKMLETIYVGGGTPSLLSAAQLERLVKMIRRYFHFSRNCELTIEANPATFDREKARIIFELGFNRVSLGVQSLNDGYLKFLGRPHDSRQARQAFEILRQVGFKNINLDLMYSFPGQSEAEIREDAVGIAAWGSEHLSLYTLTVEEGSKFFKKEYLWQDGLAQEEQYHLVTSILKEAQFEQYEVSNFARKGFESRHNICYWQGENYVGLGVGAHSHFNGERFWNVTNFMTYLNRLNDGQSPGAGNEQLSPPQRLIESLLFGLRMNEGVDIIALEERYECPLSADRKGLIERLCEDRLLQFYGERLRVTDEGRVVLDEISARLI